MGYRTDYHLEATPMTEELFEQIDVALLEHNRYFALNERSLNGEKGCWQDDDDTWFEYEEDMLAISKLFPQVRFILSGCGERNEDQWRQIFVDGRTQRCEGITVFPPFDEQQLTNQKTLNNRCDAAHGVQLTEHQENRVVEIENEVYRCIEVFLDTSEVTFAWEMGYVEEITTLILDYLIKRGHRVYRPTIVTGPNGKQYIKEHEVKENEGNEA